MTALRSGVVDLQEGPPRLTAVSGQTSFLIGSLLTPVVDVIGAVGGSLMKGPGGSTSRGIKIGPEGKEDTPMTDTSLREV